jgi:hypothetical protein
MGGIKMIKIKHILETISLCIELMFFSKVTLNKDKVLFEEVENCGVKIR